MAPDQPAHKAADPADALIPEPLLLIGGGEHAGVVLEAAESRPGRWRIVGFTDPAVAAGAALATVEHLGDDRVGLARFAGLPLEDRPALVLAVGGRVDPGLRRQVAGAIEASAPDARWAVVRHVTAWVSPSAELAEGTVVLAGAVVNAGASLGRHTIVNTRAVVEHDARIGAFVHVGPGAVIGGGTKVGSNVTIGMGALVRDHIAVGDGAIVGMGAVVVADVEPGTTVLGSPARPRMVPAAPGGVA